MRVRERIIVLLAACLPAVGLFPQAAQAVPWVATGTSVKGVSVAFQADLGISGDVLTVTLANTSPVATLNPDDTLGSFYFDILKPGNIRPTLTYASATGDVYLTSKSSPDTLQTPNANIKAVSNGDGSWQFKIMDSTKFPLLAFGLGTVGNADFNPNGFSGVIVGGVNYSIYRGDITT